MQKMEWVLVEFNGTRKTILREKLPEAQKMADEYVPDVSESENEDFEDTSPSEY